MIEPTWQKDDVSLYLGDCLEILPQLEAGSVDAVVTDPPYGINIGAMGYINNRIGGVTLRTDYSGQGEWDSKRVDLSQLLNYKTVCIWGGNFYADILPATRGWLVWDKKNGGQFSNDFADCEIAWTNKDIPSRLIRHIWHGMIQNDMSNKEKRYHPTQKPIAVMRWCFELIAHDAITILDPFMGSGTTGVACVQTGRKFIGIEIDPKYFEIAVKRISEAQLQMRLPI